MKVLLITPPFYVPLKEFAISVGQPLGIAYVGAALREAGHEVHLFDSLNEGRVPDMTPQDLSGDEPDLVRISHGVFERHGLDNSFPEGATIVGASFERIARLIRELAPDIIGISTIFTSIFRSGVHIAKIAKQINPAIITLMGGTHVTVSARKVLDYDAVDYIVAGEGEIAAPRLLAALAAGRRPDGIPGVGWRNADGTKTIIPSELNWALDELPPPAFDLLDMEGYFDTMAEGRAGKLYTTRGCPFNCSFCSVPLTSQRRFRVHSIERIIGEIGRWVTDYGVKTIIFEDDNMNTNARRYKDMLRAVIAAGLDVRVDARNLRCDLLDDETLALMRKVGFSTVWITPESGNQRVMDEIINKKMKVADSRKAARRILAAGLDVGAAFVIGFPGETRAEIQDTIDYACELKSMGVRNFWFSIATPIEGTALYQTALDAGLIDGINLDEFTYNTSVYDTSEFTRDEIKALRHRLMEELNDEAGASCGKPAIRFLPGRAISRQTGTRRAAVA